jgi:hypothetical protein
MMGDSAIALRLTHRNRALRFEREHFKGSVRSGKPLFWFSGNFFGGEPASRHPCSATNSLELFQKNCSHETILKWGRAAALPCQIRVGRRCCAALSGYRNT